MERSEIRGGVGEVPDCAALHPGYGLVIASKAKQSIGPQVETWIASLRSQCRGYTSAISRRIPPEV
jgi:hypothetical protein